MLLHALPKWIKLGIMKKTYKFLREVQLPDVGTKIETARGATIVCNNYRTFGVGETVRCNPNYLVHLTEGVDYCRVDQV
jgi:hypothetical protein